MILTCQSSGQIRGKKWIVLCIFHDVEALMFQSKYRTLLAEKNSRLALANSSHKIAFFVAYFLCCDRNGYVKGRLLFMERRVGGGAKTRAENRGREKKGERKRDRSVSV